MTKRLLFALSLAMSAAAVLPAQPPGPPFEVLRNLDLTANQQQSIQAILEKHQGSHQTRQRVLETKEQALMEAITDPAVTEAALRDLHAAASEARLSLLLEGRAILLELQEVLNPAQQVKAKEQRRKLQKAMATHHASMQELVGGPPSGPCLP